MPNKLFQPFYDTMRIAVPLTLQKKRLEFKKSQEDRAFQLGQQQLAQEAEQAKIKIAQETLKDRVSMLGDLYEKSLETSNQDLAQHVGPQLEALSGLNLPKEQTPNVDPELGLPVEGVQSRYLVPPKKDEEKGWKIKSAMLGDKPVFMRVNETTGESELLDGGFQPIQSGLKFTQDKDGNITLQQGPLGAGGGLPAQNIPLNTKTKGQVQEKAINAKEGLSRIANIVQGLEPRHLQIMPRLSNVWSSIKAKFGKDLPPEEEEALQSYAKFKQDALENINLYIKEITGAQMSEKEANRIRKAMPDPGEGVLDGDDYYTFRSNLVNIYKKLKLADARYNYYLRKGLGREDLDQMVSSNTLMSVNKFEKMMDERGRELEEQIKKQNPNITADALYKKVKSELKQEFGM